MKERILDALSRARAGYSELRLRRVWRSTVLVRDGVVGTVSEEAGSGGLARCWSPGTGWGAVGFDETEHLDARLLQAHGLSLAAASRQPVRLAAIPIRQYEGGDSLHDDPRALPLSLKRERIERLAARLPEIDRRIGASRVLAQDEVVETWLASSEGSWRHDVRSRLDLAVLAVARQDGGVERALGALRCPGWSAIDRFEETLLSTGQRVVERLEAAPVRPGYYPVVLDPAAAGALIHRAIAHLARPALPGADPDVLPLGARVGPELLTVGDDPTVPGLVATAPYDDEGTETRRATLVQNGVVLGHLHSRETAGFAGQAPTGHARAAGLRDVPYPRATHSFLAPGQGDRDDLLAGIATGVYLSDALACAASESGLLFRPGSARMIREGRLAEPVKGVRLSGELPELLGKLVAVAGDFRWEPGAAQCRDGAAGVAPVATGAPHIRLDGVPVGCELT